MVVVAATAAAAGGGGSSGIGIGIVTGTGDGIGRNCESGSCCMRECAHRRVKFPERDLFSKFLQRRRLLGDNFGRAAVRWGHVLAVACATGKPRFTQQLSGCIILN